MIHNPTIPGFFPDPSICRVGEDYFIANSSFEWFPGVPIHHSRDLTNWRLTGHALTRKSQLDLRGVPDSGGVWAPSLSHADGQFWLIYTNVRNTGMGRPFKDLDIFLTTTKNISGPWSDPIELNSIGFDPSLFHDDDGRKWLVNMIWDFRKKGVERFAGIVVQEYNHRQRKLVGPMTKILEKNNDLCEGPNLYRRDGWYYLMMAEGGTGWNHGISMARAKNLLGPYELDPQPLIITSRDDETLPLQKAGHGEIVETPAGEWYLAHLASRPLLSGHPSDPHFPDQSAAAEARAGFRCVLGRETCLQKVEWRDGWLRLAGGGHHPKMSWPAPIIGVPAPSAPARDHFDSRKLDVGWCVLRVPAHELWLSLTERPGWLRLRGRDSLHSLFDQSLIARRIQHFQFTAETCLEFSPTHFTQSAGLVCYYDTRTHFYLRVTRDEARGKILGVVLTDDGRYAALAGGEIAVNDWRQFFLRAEMDFQQLQFSASPDGKQWRNVGPVLDAAKLSDDYGAGFHFTGAMVGLCAQDVGGNQTPADFDYFDYRPAPDSETSAQRNR
jgi:xylan 1,4-beta-xylosidase